MCACVVAGVGGGGGQAKRCAAGVPHLIGSLHGRRQQVACWTHPRHEEKHSGQDKQLRTTPPRLPPPNTHRAAMTPPHRAFPPVGVEMMAAHAAHCTTCVHVWPCWGWGWGQQPERSPPGQRPRKIQHTARRASQQRVCAQQRGRAPPCVRARKLLACWEWLNIVVIWKHPWHLTSATGRPGEATGTGVSAARTSQRAATPLPQGWA